MASTARPTRQHRIALFPGLLGTVYAVSPEGEVRYFDYDFGGASEFAGTNDPEADVRRGTLKSSVTVGRSGRTQTVQAGLTVVYIRRP